VTALPHNPASSGTARRSSNQLRWKIIFVALIVAIPALIVAGIVATNGQPSAAPAASCQAVSAALANGPDPQADPVGYAEAQVRPLREITTSDAALHTAILQLSSAYSTFFKNNGTAASSKLVKAADKNVDHLCPGATS
jgi:hypothetical protein